MCVAHLIHTKKDVWRVFYSNKFSAYVELANGHADKNIQVEHKQRLFDYWNSICSIDYNFFLHFFF